MAYLGDTTQTCTSDPYELTCSANYHWRQPGKKAVIDVRTMLGPDLKLIFMFRDPVDFVVSKYAKHGEDKMEQQLDEGRGLCFADSVEGWMSVFRKENFLFIDSLDFF